MGVVKEKEERCVTCNRSFLEVNYHSKNKCRNCYNAEYMRNKKVPVEKIEKLDHCIKCLSKWGAPAEKKGKIVKQGSKGMCKMCYQRSYNRSISSCCKRCGKEMGKKIKAVCSICKIELESMKSPGRRTLPKVDRINIDKETKETMRRLLNRYKFGLNTLVDPFIVTNLYLDVFSDDNIKGRTASKTEFNLDQFDQENQVIAMLKLLKMVYDKA
jgi:hypothetical protein